MDVQVGDGTEGITARLIAPRRFAHVAYGGLKLLRPTTSENPTYQVIMFSDEEFEANKTRPLPEKSITIRLAHSRDGRLVKIVRNSNYFGEREKGIFAGEDFRAKLRGDAIFLHAGCRKDTLETIEGPYATSYSLFVALSANDINAKRVDNLFIITRGSIIPAIAKLSHEQAAAFMVLGQSMESSAGDPTQAGQMKNQFFYDPFLAGDRADHANLFYDILQSNRHIHCYLLNTGCVGEGNFYRDITLGDTMAMIDAVLRGSIGQWVLSERTGMMIPRSVHGVDSILFRPEKLFPAADFKARQKALDAQRGEFIDRFAGLEREVREVFHKPSRAVAASSPADRRESVAAPQSVPAPRFWPCYFGAAPGALVSLKLRRLMAFQLAASRGRAFRTNVPPWATCSLPRRALRKSSQDLVLAILAATCWPGISMTKADSPMAAAILPVTSYVPAEGKLTVHEAYSAASSQKPRFGRPPRSSTANLAPCTSAASAGSVRLPWASGRIGSGTTATFTGFSPAPATFRT